MYFIKRYKVNQSKILPDEEVKAYEKFEISK